MPFTDTVKLADVIIADKNQLNASVGDVLEGKQFVGNRPIISEGTISINPERSDITIVAGESYPIPKGYNPKAYNVKARDIEDETPGTATMDDIVSPKTAWINGEKLTGTIPYIGKEDVTLDCGELYAISRGYHDGTGVINARSLEEQTVASATPSVVVNGYTCWVDGERIEGEMPNNYAVSETLIAGESYTIQEGYHNGEGTITAEGLHDQTPGTAVASQIVQNETAWVNGQRLVGEMPINSSETVMLPINGTYFIPQGYHSGFGQIIQNIPTKQGETIAVSADEQTIELAGYYMEGNITIPGIDALNYQMPNTYVNDSNGNPIDHIMLPVGDNSGEENPIIVDLFADNWHDNVSLNVYRIDVEGSIAGAEVTDPHIPFYGQFFMLINNSNGSMNTINNSINITLNFEPDTESQRIKIYHTNGTHISSCKITLTDMFDSRPYGV